MKGTPLFPGRRVFETLRFRVLLTVRNASRERMVNGMIISSDTESISASLTEHMLRLTLCRCLYRSELYIISDEILQAAPRMQDKSIFY